jgi:DUF2075 family protein/DNA replication protein DnaC
MPNIQHFPFDIVNLDLIKEYRYGKNWPVVYIQENGKQAYIGQSTNVHLRTKQHLKNQDRQKLTDMYIITDDEFNMSVAYDIESLLIEYMSADQKFELQNRNDGLRNHNYFDREKYRSKFETVIWKKLRELKLAIKSYTDLKNSDIFKFSPYKTLTADQRDKTDMIYEDFKLGRKVRYLINGNPGTGKTVLAIYLLKFLKDNMETKNLEIGFVVPMTSLRKTIKRVFRKIKGLEASMIIGPNDVVKKNYDLLIVDEAHRLSRRKNITNYASFDKTNRILGLDNNGTQLDWIKMSAENYILFYDPNQSVKPSDINPQEFDNLDAIREELESQLRVEGGEEYIQFVEDLFNMKKPILNIKNEYEVLTFDNINSMTKKIKEKEAVYKLCRIVAGYAWPWHTKDPKTAKQDYDFELDKIKFTWNSTAQDWVNSDNAINEVGCIHTIQGYDLNYVGVIIGPELSYDKVNKRLVVDKKKYFDRNGHAGITDPNELEGYIKNIYKTLLTRGIKGTYIYVVDKNLREYLYNIINRKL